MSNIQHNKHLMWRAGFGVDCKNINKLNFTSTKDLINSMFKAAKIYVPEYFDVADNRLKRFFEGLKELKDLQDINKKELSKEQRKMLREQSREDLKNLNINWCNAMINGNSPLTEKMALFWHGHFACREINIFFQQKLLHEIRTYALGSFKDLLKAVSKSAAMLQFLNNQQNKKQKPNENFAREVMELFTLGRGNYTEQDIKEAAKAFTGWGFNFSGEFVFRKMLHDDSSKTILGKTGFFDGDDVLDILLQQKQTAIFITTKIYKYFVNEKVNEKHIVTLSDKFFKSDYNIALLMQEIFTSNWFYNKENIGCKIKSPVELIIGLQKQLLITLTKPQIQLLLQKALGQLLFYPPNVAGWPGGKNWIDTSTLMIRLQIPRLIKDDDEFAITTKTDDDVQMGMKEMQPKKMDNVGSNKFKINAQVNWQEYIQQFADVKREQLLQSLKDTLLITNNLKDEALEPSIDSSSRESYIKTATINLMSTPEYQMC